jgi:hypothetical protein
MEVPAQEAVATITRATASFSVALITPGLHLKRLLSHEQTEDPLTATQAQTIKEWRDDPCR